MIRHFYAVYVIFAAFVMVGCGFVGKQEWSENYAAAEGGEATSLMMIDGNLSTIGETQTPADTGGRTEFSEAVVKLPEKKSIRRVVLYTPNIQSFTIYAAGEDEDTWKSLKQIKNNEEKKIVMNVSAVTDKIRIRVRRTSDDERLPGGRSRRRQVRRAKGKIQEIEIYGLVEVKEAEEGAAQVGEVAEQAATPGAFGTPSRVSAQKAVEKPKAPPAVLILESPQSVYTLAGPIPARISLRIGPDDLVVLADHVSDQMLSTKLLVKTASGKKIKCSKPTPRLSRPETRPTSSGPTSVRNARTLDANSVITVDMADLLEYYPIKEPGSYTVQLDMKLEVHTKFIDRIQAQIEDIERSIRGVSAKSTYSQTERASIIQELREEIEELKKKKRNRYLVAGARGKSLDLKSNVLELVIR